jgi:hypothetical protein
VQDRRSLRSQSWALEQDYEAIRHEIEVLAQKQGLSTFDAFSRISRLVRARLGQEVVKGNRGDKQWVQSMTDYLKELPEAVKQVLGENPAENLARRNSQEEAHRGLYSEEVRAQEQRLRSEWSADAAEAGLDAGRLEALVRERYRLRGQRGTPTAEEHFRWLRGAHLEAFDRLLRERHGERLRSPAAEEIQRQVEPIARQKGIDPHDLQTELAHWPSRQADDRRGLEESYLMAMQHLLEMKGQDAQAAQEAPARTAAG